MGLIWRAGPPRPVARWLCEARARAPTLAARLSVIMPLDPRAKRFLDTLAAMNPPSALSLTAIERRRALEQLLSFSGPPEAVAAVRDLSIPGRAASIRLRLYTPAGAQPGQVLPGLVYFHGGGLVAGSLETHDPIGRSLCNASGCRLVSVDYRLGPEYPFPAAVEDGQDACAWAFAHPGELGIDPNQMGICGDSAGATLAAVVCHAVASWKACAARRTSDSSQGRPAIESPIGKPSLEKPQGTVITGTPAMLNGPV